MNYDFVVWDPLTNEKHRLPRPSPPPTAFNSNVAVLCAATAEGCDHGACHSGPFLVAFIWSNSTGLLDPKVTYARVYSSVTGDWSEPSSVQHPHASLEMTKPSCPTRLVGDKLYFSCLFRYNFMYELDAQRLSVILPPPLPLYKRHPLFNVMYIEDDGLGCVEVEKEPRPCLRLWSRVTAANGDGVACWERGRVIELETLLPDGALLAQQLASDSSTPNRILGFAEGTDVVFVGIHTLDHLGAVYMVQHNSGRAKKLFDKGTLVVAYTSFCIPVID
ncbi:hypothetical protein EJB05_34151 [Eragrostis curvula]|uniref:DUF1618 domain-containing protein n=1 Tax=Eragrostis curvula TaxID=38414 RepID=A0A5J9U4N8_9POAL|nr:hypothetical protein EJB05_34151 [Eragrostis curvula]